LHSVDPEVRSSWSFSSALNTEAGEDRLDLVHDPGLLSDRASFQI
jgi:hypothetical protein